MMKYTLDEFNRAKAKMANDINAAINDSKDQLKAAATEESGEEFAAAPTKIEERSGNAPARRSAASRPVIARARGTAAATGVYVRHNPWTAVGVAAAAGVLIGLLAARR